MNSLVAYGSDDENDERYYDEGTGRPGAGPGGGPREDDTNYDDVTMDMSEDSNNNESDRELPPADDPAPAHDSDEPHTHSDGKERSESPRRDRRQSDKERDRPGREERDKHTRDGRDAREREHRDDRRGDRGRYASSSRRGLLGDKPDSVDTKAVPALMDLKPFGGEPPLPLHKGVDPKDTKDSRGSERERREYERERDRERDRHRDSHKEKDRHARRSPERKHKRSRSRDRRSSRDRERDRSHDRPPADSQPRSGPSTSAGDYRPSYKVSKKLQVMEKMGLQIKTPDGSMTTAQQLMQRSASEQHAGPGPAAAASYFRPGAVAASLVAQVEKRKLLWSKKSSESEKSESKPLPESAAKWTGTRFAQDADGKVANKFMRLMGIKQPEMVKASGESDVNEKQERMFQDMQAQYEVARATTHTMRGVGLGFQRHL